MKRFSRVLCLLMVACVMLTSCLSSSDSDLTLHNDAAITAFSLGTVNRYLYMNRPSTGVKDSLVKTTFTGSLYPMSIDQIGYRIFNQDSLPYGTDAAHLLCNITTMSSSGVAIKNLNDTTFKWFSSSDSIDFSEPRTLRVFATDGSYKRDYTVWVNVAKGQNVIDVGWSKVSDNDAFGLMEGMRLVVLNNRLVVFGEQGGKTLVFASADGKQFQQLATEGLQHNAWQNVVVKDSYVYMLNGATLLRSQDAGQWEQLARHDQLRQLVAAGTKELFAIGTDGLMKHSTDDGLTWTDEQTDEPASLLPTQGIASTTFAYAPSDSTDYVLLVGNDGTQSRVWHKISQYGSRNKGGRWVRMTSSSGLFELPLHAHLSLAYYKGVLLAAGNGARTLYISHDQGLTWNVTSDYSLPTTAQGDWLTMTVAPNGTLWAITSSGQVWTGGIK